MHDPKLAVLHTVGSMLPDSGVTPFIQNNLAFRAERGWPTACLYFANPIPPTQELESPRLHPLAKPRGPWRQYQAFAQAVRRHVLEWRQQGHQVLIHDHGLWLPSNLASSAVARELRCPSIVSPHGMLQPVALTHASLKKRLAWKIYEHRRLRRTDRLHATAPHEVDAIRAHLPQARIALVKLSIDVPAELPHVHARQPEVLYLGRLHPIKGVDLLIKAWAKLRPAGWHLRLVGPCEPEYGASLQALIEHEQLQKAVSMEGPLHGDAKLQAFDRASIFVLPSYSENFGMVVCEALARGVPVITTDNTPWHDLPERGCGWVCQATVEDLSRGLAASTALAPDHLAHMGQTGWSWMRESFDLHVVMQDMERHYQSLCPTLIQTSDRCQDHAPQ